jgi:hypothetical protein
MASGRDGFRPSALATAELGGSTGSSPQKIRLQLVAFFTRELDRQNKLEQRPTFAIR